MKKIVPGDQVVVVDDVRYPHIRCYSEVSGSLRESGSLTAGACGTVTGITASVVGEDRLVCVRFSDKSCYVSERFVSPR